MYAIIDSDNRYLTMRVDYPDRIKHKYYCNIVIIFPSFKRAKQYCYNRGIDMRYYDIVRIEPVIQERYELTNQDTLLWWEHLGKFLK